MEARIDWLEKELERVDTIRIAANKEAKTYMKEMLELVAARAPISAKLRILSDPEKQYELHDWRSKGGDDVLLPLMINEYQMEEDYLLFVEQMEAACAGDRVSKYGVFKHHPVRHFQYVSYLQKLGKEFVKGGGGRTYDEFDMHVCRQISKNE